MFNNDYDIMTIDKVCDYLDVWYNTVYKLLSSGKLGAFRIGNRWKIPRKCVDEYVDKSVKKWQKEISRIGEISEFMKKYLIFI